jgi:hypothetical protein
MNVRLAVSTPRIALMALLIPRFKAFEVISWTVIRGKALLAATLQEKGNTPPFI